MELQPLGSHFGLGFSWHNYTQPMSTSPARWATPAMRTWHLEGLTMRTAQQAVLISSSESVILNDFDLRFTPWSQSIDYFYWHESWNTYMWHMSIFEGNNDYIKNAFTWSKHIPIIWSSSKSLVKIDLPSSAQLQQSRLMTGGAPVLVGGTHRTKYFISLFTDFLGNHYVEFWIFNIYTTPTKKWKTTI